ncbi:MAG TPA: hypothetical protein VN493_09505 [Thermoanaerobaculia bacterium]|nr:hypothetical protein [Thermoanaerobaculia bacterium]
MANSFFWDIGFDFNSVQNPRTGEDFLAIGLVLAQPNNADVPATPVGISIGDTIGFFAYDITSNPTGTSSITGGAITFTNAVPQSDSNNNTITSPFNNSTGDFLTSISIPALTNIGTGMSTIFSGIQAPQASTTNNAATFTKFSIGSMTVNNLGRFMMTVELTVQVPNGNGGTTTKTFFVDPEMIVGGTNQAV